VLEGKERDELQAIAQAMSLRTTSRTKKADIIEQILQATGVISGASNGAEDLAVSGAGQTASSNGAAGNGRAAGTRATTRRSRSAAAASDPGGDTLDGADRAGSTAVATEVADSAGPSAGSIVAPSDGSREGAIGDSGAAPTTAPTANGDDAATSMGSEAPASDSAVAGTPDGVQNGAAANGEHGDGVHAAGPADAEQPQNANGHANGALVTDVPETGTNGDHAVADGRPSDSDGSGSAGSAGQGGAFRPQARTATNNQPTNNQPTNNQQGGIDTANRRGRRRRGRERVPGGDRELQGSAPEANYQGDLVEVRGLLDLRDEGYGFLRCDGYLPSSKDVYVSISQARRFALRKGDYIEGACRPASNNEKYPALLRIDTVSGQESEAARSRPRFEDLTPLFPDSKLNLEMPGDKDNVTARIVDLLSPIGKGQRGLIVSPPKAGKTTIMKQIAHSIEVNNPEVHLMVLLVDERPEEVTDMRRSVRGEVVASTFDRPSDEHTAVAELAIERAKRLVEMGRDVVIILDGITRLARAYNLAAPATGRIMSGGVDSGALYPPKKFFGAARNIEEGGSLTILATALVETGSKMDEVIFEEFKGTGNMELRLDRRLAERRLYPSIDVNASSTRHEELLFDRGQLQQVWKLRRVLNALASDGNAASGLELLMDKIRTTRSNDEFLAEIAKGPTLN
jgi:transcription termination factor Rho